MISHADICSHVSNQYARPKIRTDDSDRLLEPG